MEIRTAEKRVAVPGMEDAIRVEYLTAGSGAPLLLLHGVGDSARTWERVIPALARRHRVLAPSFPGFGASARTPGAYSPEFFAAVVVAFLDALGMDRVAIAGNSLGGLVGMRVALAAPARVRALVLVDSAGLGREISKVLRVLTLPGAGVLVPKWHRTAVGSWHWALSLAAQLFGNPRRAPGFWVRNVRRMARSPGYLEATVATVRSGTTLRGQRKREILLDRLEGVTAPTLVVWGGRDRVVPVEHARQAVARLPWGELAVFPGSGHLPHLECPDDFVRALEDFLASAKVDRTETVRG